MRRIKNLDDKTRIRLLKIALGLSVAYNAFTIWAAYDMLRVYEKTHHENIRNTLNRVFDVLDPTVDQLEEIKAMMDFDSGIDDFLKDLAK